MRKVLLVNDTRVVGHHGSSAVVEVIIQQLAERGVIVQSHLEHGIDICSLAETGWAGREWQGVIINGEGAMHSGQKNSHLFSRIGLEGSRSGVPVFLINTVFDEHTPEILARMRHFARIYCRETHSVERLGSSGAQAELCPDLTFALDLPIHGWRPGPTIVVLDTTVAVKNRKLHQFSRDNDLRFQPIRTSPRLVRISDHKNLARVVRFNANRYIGKLLPAVYTFNRYSNAVSDHHAFIRRIAEGTRVVVAARFHGVCFCMKVGVPFLAIASNTPKIEGMLADAELGDRMLNIDELDVPEIERRALWTTTHEERRLQYIEHAKGRIAEMFDEISDMLH